MSSKNKHDVTREYVRATADLHCLLWEYGDTLAKEEGYKSHSGIDAVHFYLVEKYKWTPSVVKALNYDDLHFLMSEKMSNRKLPRRSVSE